MLQDSTVLPSELIPAVAYQITLFPFSFRQYHIQADTDLVRGMAFAFEVQIFLHFFFPLHHAFSTNRKFLFRNELHSAAEHVSAILLISSVIGKF